MDAMAYGMTMVNVTPVGVPESLRLTYRRTTMQVSGEATIPWQAAMHTP